MLIFFLKTHRVKANALLQSLFFTTLLATPAWSAPLFEKADGSNLYFKDDTGGKSITLKTGVPDVKFIAIQMSHNGQIPYALFSGRACNKCTENQVGIFMMRLDGKGKSFQFVYPGRITDSKKGQIVFNGRSFYGNCLSGVKQGLVTHQSEIIDRRRGLQKSVLVIEPGDYKVEERLIEKRVPSINTTLTLVKNKVCTEIPGLNRLVLKKPLDLTPREGLNDDEEDTDLNDLKDTKEGDPKETPEVTAEPGGDT
jgi:hypothetical protein